MLISISYAPTTSYLVHQVRLVLTWCFYFKLVESILRRKSEALVAVRHSEKSVSATSPIYQQNL